MIQKSKKDRLDKRRQEITLEIDRMIDPDALSREEAMEILEEFEADIQCRLDCLKEEIENQEPE
jgi:hypothetical protein